VSNIPLAASMTFVSDELREVVASFSQSAGRYVQAGDAAEVVISGVWHFLIGGIAALAVVGCGNLPRIPVPIDQIDMAQVPGMPAVRTWGGEISDHFQRDLVQSIHDEKGLDYIEQEDGTRGHMALAVSGGGAFVAFGAGFVNGWTDAGTRPVFKLVTGIRAGALVAPFAYLGVEYDQQLKEALLCRRARPRAASYWSRSGGAMTLPV
jgi:hypothetical protein